MSAPKLIEVGRVTQLVLPNHFGDTHDIHVSVGSERKFGWSIVGQTPNNIGEATVTLPPGRVLEVVSDSYTARVEDPEGPLRIKHRRTTRDFPDAHRPTVTIMNEGGDTGELARVGAVIVSQNIVEDGSVVPGIRLEGLDVDRFIDLVNTAGNNFLPSRSCIDIRRSRIAGENFDSTTDTRVNEIPARRMEVSKAGGLRVVEL